MNFIFQGSQKKHVRVAIFLEAPGRFSWYAPYFEAFTISEDLHLVSCIGTHTHPCVNCEGSKIEIRFIWVKWANMLCREESKIEMRSKLVIWASMLCREESKDEVRLIWVKWANMLWREECKIEIRWKLEEQIGLISILSYSRHVVIEHWSSHGCKEQ